MQVSSVLYYLQQLKSANTTLPEIRLLKVWDKGPQTRNPCVKYLFFFLF